MTSFCTSKWLAKYNEYKRFSVNTSKRKIEMTEETIKEILKFRDDRDWKQFHNPKDTGNLHFTGGSRTSGSIPVEWR